MIAKDFSYRVRCNICGWESAETSSTIKAGKEAKLHLLNTPHSDYQNVSMFDERTRADISTTENPR